MSKTTSRQTLLGLVDSDSDDDLGASFASVEHHGSSALKKRPAKTMPPKKAAGRPAVSKVTKKPAKKTTTRRANDRLAVAVEAAIEAPDVPATSKPGAGPAKRGRKAAVKLDEVAVPVSPPSSGAAKGKGARGRPKAQATAGSGAKEQETSEEVPKATAAAPARRGRKPAAKIQPTVVEDTLEISETQEPQDAMEVDDDTGVEQEVVTAMDDLTAISPIASPPGRALPLSMSSPAKVRNRPAAGAIDFDESDSSLRRRLGDLTKKHDALETKYRDLREIGVKEAERTFDRYKKQSEDRAKTAADLISKLKEELAAQKDLAKEGQRHKQDLDAKHAEAVSLAGQVVAMENALAEARKEIKTLATRLSASRTVEVPHSLKAPPGSALKTGAGAGSAAARAAASAEAIQIAQASQMKEDLYGDLTGLIVRGVKRTDEEDLFDCIQTGRNGTLHFKLSIGNDMSAENYDEVQFMYMPQLDASRDRALIDMLPDYLVEEISFPRPHAAKFYSRVMRSLTERVDHPE